jgi:hypothetical protein
VFDGQEIIPYMPYDWQKSVAAKRSFVAKTFA